MPATVNSQRVGWTVTEPNVAFGVFVATLAFVLPTIVATAIC